MKKYNAQTGTLGDSHLTNYEKLAPTAPNIMLSKIVKKITKSKNFSFGEFVKFFTI